jgi:hypothetical protein
MRHTHDTTFSENILDFYKILEESEQFFLLFRPRAVYQHIHEIKSTLNIT